MINVYSENTTNFNNNGLATLIPLTAKFSPDINGAWTLSITHPYDPEGRHEHLVKNAILQADVGCIREQSSKQLFRIYDVKRNLQSLSVIAFPIGMEATFDAPIEELKIPDEAGVSTASGVDAAAVLNNYIKIHDDNDKYTVSSNVATQSRSQWENTNLIAALSGSDDNSFINKWGGEVLYNNYAINIKNRIGNANPKFPVEYGKNLTGMEHDLDMSTVITRAYPLSTDGLRLHQYDDLDIDYWYGTFDGDERKNYAKSQYLYSYNDHAWYQFDSDGKLLTDPIPAEMLAILNQFDWHENETGWWYGLNSTYYIKDAWVEDANGKHYWMDSQGYMDSQYTDTDVWTWNQFDDSGEHYGEKRNSFVDSPHHFRDYPYIRSAFLSSPYQLLDTDSKSNSLTAQATAIWKAALYDAIEAKAEELWNAVLTDTTNTYCTDYLQELIDDIVTYTQARYVYSHKGWQSLIKSLIKSGIEWIKDEELDEEGWIEVNGYMYGDFDNDGNFLNYPKSQYLYCYSESKWYYFEADGLMSTDEIPAETIALLNTYDWHTDSTGTYYGDGVPGSGNYMKSAWIENSDGTHSWVGADGYYDAQWDDSTAWDWTEINGWRYGRSSTQYVRSCYIEVDKNLEYFGADGFWRDWMRVPAEDMGWYQVKDGANAGKWWYGSLNRYYAHNEYVYMTVDGTLEEWFYDEEGWYDEDKSGETDYAWQEDSTGHWFGTEDEDTGEKDKYIHDKWTFIDGTYYWFDSDGYISGDANKAKQNWQWGDLVDEVTGDHWFGNEHEDFNRMWLAGQWMKIDGEWYHFNSDGYMDDESTKRSQTITWFSNAIVAALNPVASEKLKEAYDMLYDQMTKWVTDQYAEEDNPTGIDMPNITVTVDLVDLSKTSEYADCADLEKIYLGDSVLCKDVVHDIQIEARVVGLTYDVIRGYNTKVTIGQLGKDLSQILNVNYKGSGDSDTTLIAGDGIHKDGNIISVEDGNNGTSYGLQDATYKDASIVRDNVAILDDAITEVEANPSGEAGAELAKLRVGNNVYSIPEGSGGLEYWEETSDQFYREYEVEGMSADDGYILTNPDDWYNWYSEVGRIYYGAFAFRKKNDVPAIIVAVENGTAVSRFYLISTVESATKWEYKSLYVTMDWTDPTGGTDTDSSRGSVDGYVTDNHGTTWYYSRGVFGSTGRTPCLDYDFIEIEGSPWTKSDDEWVEQILGISHASPTTTVKVGIGKDDKILYQKVGEDYVAYLDDTGAYEGTDYKVNGESLVTKINSKQDKLIQGTNITIGADGKTISATDTDELSELGDVAVSSPSNGQVLKYNSTTSKWENGTGGGGSSVIANPQDTPTDTLETIEIDGTVYDIAGSGGGSGYEETTLWEDANGQTFSGQSTYTANLDGEITEYDMLEIEFAPSTDPTWHHHSLVPVNQIDTTGTNGFMCTIVGGNAGYTPFVQYTDADTLLFTTWGRAYSVNVYKIVGIKFGSGSSGGGAIFEGLDYANAEAMNLPALGNTGYTYTPTENGVIMHCGYGSNGGVRISSANFTEEIFLAHISDRWTCPWCFVEKDVEYTIKSMPNSHAYPSGSWLKFIPLKNTDGGSSESEEIPLFKNGSWKNQSILTITPYLATISNNELVCQGVHAGIVVSDVTRLTGYAQYQLKIKISSANGVHYQTGKCNPTTDLDGIIRRGDGRISYSNDSVASGEWIIAPISNNNTYGLFFGGYYLETVDYTIKEITLVKFNTKEYSW